MGWCNLSNYGSHPLPLAIEVSAAPQGPLHLVGIVGSLRQASFNRALFDAAVELVGGAPSRVEVHGDGGGVMLTEVDITAVPFFNADLEASGDPRPVVELREAVRAADGLVLFSPEYNLSVPAVVKNAVDWLSRVPGDSALTTASVGVVAGTRGGHEAAGVRGHLGDTLERIAGRFYPTTLGLGSLHEKVSDGVLVDHDARLTLGSWLEGFVAHVRQAQPLS
jgi:chromate reductase